MSNDFITARRAILDRNMNPELVREADDAFGRIEVRVTALEALAEACGGLIGNHGAGRERGLSEIPSEVLGSILGAMQNTNAHK